VINHNTRATNVIDIYAHSDDAHQRVYLATACTPSIAEMITSAVMLPSVITAWAIPFAPFSVTS
jgi:hypothetical protein